MCMYVVGFAIGACKPQWCFGLQYMPIGIKESGFDYKMAKHDSRVASGMSARINR